MSIHNLSNRPCPTCKCDTTHLVNKCTECGTITPTGSEQWRNRQVARRIRYRAVYGKVVGDNMLTAEKERREREQAAYLKRTGRRHKDLPSFK